MKHKLMSVLIISILFIGYAYAQMERPNVIWARTITDSLVVDGVLDEAAWANAESFHWSFGENTDNIPGSGYNLEGNKFPSDPSDITVRFLAYNNWLYMAAEVQDSSVGGGLFNKFDGFLMNMRDHSSPNRPAPAHEMFYGWVTEPWADTTTGAVGADPQKIGGGSVNDLNWNGKTVVDGITNSDTLTDNGYITEFKFDLSGYGYDITQTEGDIVEFNMSVYDADWQWPLDTLKFSGNRCWWQGPWGNASSNDLIRIYSRPNVTTESGDVPLVGPEMIIQNGANFDDPVIDGVLDDAVWAWVKGFDIKYGDEDLRNSYDGIGPYRGGEFQPEINGMRASVVDPADATIKVFFKGNMLYLSAIVRDQAVWYIDNFDQWDGVRFIINDREERDVSNHNLVSRQLTAHIDTLGQLKTENDLTDLIDSSAASAAMTLTGSTTVSDFNDVDEGYVIEMAVDLTELGYTDGLGDGVLFFSATLFDGDKVNDNPDDDYGNRVWFYRESAGAAGPAWAYMDPENMVTGIRDITNGIPYKFEIIGNYPNPFNPTTTIEYALPAAGSVKINVFNVLGQYVFTEELGQKVAGYKKYEFNASFLSSGLYFYNIELRSAGKTKTTGAQKMLLIK